MSAQSSSQTGQSTCPDCGREFDSYRAMRIHQGHGCGDDADTEDTAESEFDCPTCDQSFDTERGVKIHHIRTHDESIVESEIATCAECNDEFEVTDGADGKYCSRDCFFLSQREGEWIGCLNCGEEFWVTPYDLEEGRQYCSSQCYGEAKDTTELRECRQCGRRFRSQAKKDAEYCCRACFHEAYADHPRPDHVPMLLWLLYVYEAHNSKQTFRRQRAVLGVDEALTREDVKETLRELGVYDPGGEARRALEEATPDEFGCSETPDGDDAWKQVWNEEGTSS